MDVIAQRTDHVPGMRGHHIFAVLLHAYGQVLRIGDFVAGHNPGPESREGIESLPDVAGIVHTLAPGVALAEVPADGVAEDVLKSALLGHIPGGLPDYRAQLAFEVDMLRYAGQHHRA